MHSEEPLARPQFKKLPTQLNIEQDTISRMVISLCRLCDASEHWQNTFRNYLTHELHLSPTSIDQELCAVNNGKLREVLWSMVENVSSCGSKSLQAPTTNTE